MSCWRRSGVLGSLVLGLVTVCMLAWVPADHSRAYGSTPHSPIVIDGDSGFIAPNGVTGGTGTEADPFVIEGWEVTPDAVTHRSIDIQNTNAHLILWNITSFGTIYLSNVENAVITEVNISTPYRGIDLVQASNITVSDCEVFSIVSEAVSTDVSGNLTISGNHLNGVRLRHGSNVTFSNNVMSLVGAGVDLHECSDSRVEGNAFADTAFFVGQLNIVGCENVSVSDNSFSEDPTGLFLEANENVTVSMNTFDSTGITIYGWSEDEWSAYEISQDNLVNGKPLHYYKAGEDLAIDGIDVGQLIVGNYSNVSIANIAITDTSIGIMMGFVNHSIIDQVNVSQCGYGIQGTYCNDTMITDSTLLSNNYGLEFDECEWSLVYHNRFLFNTHQVSYLGSHWMNRWDAGYPTGGNYWSNYTGSDDFSGPGQDIAGADGIGDDPMIPANNVIDQYPWVSESFVIIPEFGAILIPVVGLLAAVLLGAACSRKRKIS